MYKNKPSYFPGLRDFGKKFIASIAAGFIVGGLIGHSLILWAALFGVTLVALVWGDIRGLGITVGDLISRAISMWWVIIPTFLLITFVETVFVLELVSAKTYTESNIIGALGDGIVAVLIIWFFHPFHQERRS